MTSLVTVAAELIHPFIPSIIMLFTLTLSKAERNLQREFDPDAARDNNQFTHNYESFGPREHLQCGEGEEVYPSCQCN